MIRLHLKKITLAGLKSTEETQASWIVGKRIPFVQRDAECLATAWLGSTSHSAEVVGYFREA